MGYHRAGFDVIHASPPCQAYSVATVYRERHDALYERTRERLIASGTPWVIENVPGAPYRQGAVLCGSAFGLRIRRHRNFESSLWLASSGCRHREQGIALGIYGNGGGGKYSGHGGTKAHRREFASLMQMPWASPSEIAQAIPPAYTEFIGEQLLAHLGVRS